MGLEALNENLPEINIDLTYKWGAFKPSLISSLPF
jgi:hypothetical protein